MKYFVFFALIASQLMAANTWYIDNTATGTGSGNSWLNAMTTFKAAFDNASIVSGDTIYVSGGSTGNTQTYSSSSSLSFPGQFFPQTGTTWQIGQDSAHNGTILFNGQSTGAVFQVSTNVIISGEVVGDTARHWKLVDNTTVNSAGSCNNSSNFRLSYIDFGSQDGNSSTALLIFNPGHLIEVDHCSFTTTGTTSSAIIYAQLDGTGFGQNSFHDNVLSVRRFPSGTTGSGGNGSDGFEIVGSTPTTGGFDIYNNTISSISDAAWNGNQHQDGWQGSQGGFIRIFKNRITNMTNYGLYAEPNSGSYSNVIIYDNIIVAAAFAGSQGIVAAADSNLGLSATNFIIANNTVDGYDNPITFRNPNSGSADPTAFVNCHLYNNTVINVSGTGNLVNPSVVAATNVTVTAGNAPSYFTTWASTGTGSNTPASANYVLLAGATPLIHTGTNVSSYGITTDFIGAAFANPPSIGAYEFGGGGSAGGSSMLGKITLSGNITIK